MYFLRWICWWCWSSNQMYIILRWTRLFFSNHALSFILVLRKPIWTVRVMIFSYRYEDTIIFYGIYLDSLQIVPCNPQKHHPIPADVLPSDSEDLFENQTFSWKRHHAHVYKTINYFLLFFIQNFKFPHLICLCFYPAIFCFRFKKSIFTA